jgi:hypothetical protein
MAKTITTIHRETGYSNNVGLVADALGTHFGFADNSHIQTAVAAHIWSRICHMGEEKRWGSDDVKHALDCIRARLADLDAALGKIAPEAAPLRLSGLVRTHSVGNTRCGTDVALIAFGAADDASPLAVVTGENAPALAKQILTSVNGRIPTLRPA